MTFRDEGTPLGKRVLPAMNARSASGAAASNANTKLRLMERVISEVGHAETEPGFCKKHGDVQRYVFVKVLKSGSGRIDRPCVKCVSERDRARYAANPEFKKAHNAAYVKVNRKKTSTYERLRRRRKRREVTKQ